jgi:hypothetical protein
VGRVAATSWAYLILWFGSLAVSIVLVVLLRTRWGQSRPLHKCALLSLLVHLMLAWAAVTVRFVAGGHGGGSGPPIRVRVVNDGNGSLTMADTVDVAFDEAAPPAEVAPPLLEPPKEKVEAPVQEAAPAAFKPAVQEVAKTQAEGPSVEVDESIAPEEPDRSEPAADRKPDPPLAETETDVADTPRTAAAANASPVAPAPKPSSPANATQVAVSPAVAATAGSHYSRRNEEGRLELVEGEGGNAETEAAVSAALRWLASAQSRDGRWEANRFGAGQEHAVLGHNRGGAGRGADTGISSLALLAFLGAGHSHLGGAYQDTVRRGLDFLLRSQAADGSLFGEATLYAQMYCHSMATFALAEAQAMTGDRRLEPAVVKAVNFCLASQNATSGGWRYRPGDSGDTSQLGWQMMALASAERAGIRMPSNTWIRVERFLRSVRRGSYGGLASYRPDSGPSTSMTAEALYCRLLLEGVHGEALEESAAAEAAGALLAAVPTAERVNLYYWYYATLALHHRHQQNERAAIDWQTWNEALMAALLATQVNDGADVGSWNTNTVWGGYGGRVYTTAMAAMCLEVYYRYAPSAPRGRWTAVRPETPAASR